MNIRKRLVAIAAVGALVAVPVAGQPASAHRKGKHCKAGYRPCLHPASDYDCRGGSGDGPRYTGTVRVTGSDPYGLDTDNDGWGCE